MKILILIFTLLSISMPSANATGVSIGGQADYHILDAYQQVRICWGHRRGCTYLDTPEAASPQLSCPATDLASLTGIYPPEHRPRLPPGTLIDLIDYLRHHDGPKGRMYAEVLDCPSIRHDAWSHAGLLCIAPTSPNTAILSGRLERCYTITGFPGD